MKKKLLSIALVLVLILSASASAFAANQYSSMYSGVTGDETAVYVTDTFNKVVWKYSEGTLSLFAGQIAPTGLGGAPEGAYVDASLSTARFTEPWAIVKFMDGWAVSDASAHVVRYIDDTAVRTLAGSGRSGTSNGSGKGASFMRPTGLAVDDAGNLYVADSDAGNIRKITTKGTVTTFYSGLSEPTGLAWKDGYLYIAETGNNRIVKIKNNALTVVAGGTEGYTDGSVSSAKFSAPQGVAVADDGSVIVADTGNSAVRKISGKTVTTLMSSSDTEYDVVAPVSVYVTGPYAVVADNYTGELTVKSIEDEAPFADVAADAWYADAVGTAADMRLIYGTGAGSFSPDQTFTRAQLVTVLSRLEQMKDRNLIIDGTADFSDVSSSSYYAQIIGWAYENGLVSGYPDGSFAPGEGITRADIAVLLYRYAVKTGLIADISYSADLSSYKDADAIPSYAVNAMSWAVGSGLIKGSESCLYPQSSAKRCEAVQLIVNFAEYVGL